MKNQYLLFITLFAFAFSNAQIVDIPDYAFKNRLVNYNCVDTDGNGGPDADADTNNDGEIQVSEAEAVINLILHGYEWEQIYSLEGIQSFQNIERLSFSDNSVSELDITQNQNLLWLECPFNLLTSLDVSQNPNLLFLWCSFNDLTNLDVSNNLNLRSLSCSSNQFTSLDVSNNEMLYAISCIYSQLSNLDVSQNPNLELLRCYGSNLLMSLNIKNGNNDIIETMLAFDNPNLTCILVDDENTNYPNCDSDNDLGWCKDEWASYSEDCELGLEDNTQISFTIYPNPVQDILNIEPQLPLETVEIYNLQGQLISESSKSRVDVSQLNAGLYFLQVIIDGKKATKKFIKE